MTEHVLSRCKWTAGVWNICKIAEVMPMKNVTSAVQWFRELVHEVSISSDAMSKLGLVAHICWCPSLSVETSLSFLDLCPAMRGFELCFFVNGEFFKATYIFRVVLFTSHIVS